MEITIKQLIALSLKDTFFILLASTSYIPITQLQGTLGNLGEYVDIWSTLNVLSGI